MTIDRIILKSNVESFKKSMEVLSEGMDSLMDGRSFADIPKDEQKSITELMDTIYAVQKNHIEYLERELNI